MSGFNCFQCADTIEALYAYIEIWLQFLKDTIFVPTEIDNSEFVLPLRSFDHNISSIFTFCG